MNFARQTTHNQHSTTHKFGGQLASATAEDEPTSSVTIVDGLRFIAFVESVRGVPGRSPGLWDLASQSERRWFASSSSEYPPKVPQARGCDASAEQAPGTPKLGRANNLQHNTQKQMGVPARTGLRYSPGTPVSSDLPSFIGGKSAATFEPTRQRESRKHLEPFSRRADQFRAASLGVLWVVDHHRRHLPVSLFHYGSLRIQSSVISDNAPMARRVPCPPVSYWLAIGISGPNSCMEEERRVSFSQWLRRSGLVRVSHCTGIAQLAIGNSVHAKHGGSFPEDSPQRFSFPASQLFSLRLATLSSFHFKPLSFRVELKRSVRDCYGVVWQLSFRITCREVCSIRWMQANPATREPGV